MLVKSRHTGILLHSLTKVDVTETTTSDLTTDAVLVAHAEVLDAVSDVVHGVAVYGRRCGRVSRGERWEGTHHGRHVCG